MGITPTTGAARLPRPCACGAGVCPPRKGIKGCVFIKKDKNSEKGLDKGYKMRYNSFTSY